MSCIYPIQSRALYQERYFIAQDYLSNKPIIYSFAAPLSEKNNVRDYSTESGEYNNQE